MVKKETAARRRKNDTAEVPWYRTAEAVKARKDKSRKALVVEGGRELRAIRLDSAANEAFQILQGQSPDLDNGGIVREALIEAAKRVSKRLKG